MSAPIDAAHPVDLTVDKPAREFRVEWASGEKSAYGFDYLAALCPCANCKEERKARERNPLAVLSGPGGPAELETWRWWGATPSTSSGGAAAAQEYTRSIISTKSLPGAPEARGKERAEPWRPMRLSP